MANRIQQHLVPLWVLTAHITTELVATCNIYGGKNLNLLSGVLKHILIFVCTLYLVFHKYVGVVITTNNMEIYQFSKKNIKYANADMFIVAIFFIITSYK